MKSQKDAVLDYLKRFGHISSLKAIEEFGCTRLSAIIWILRHKDGYEITSKTETTKNRFGNSTTYSVYELRGERNA